jgi:hypothetical protein
MNAFFCVVRCRALTGLPRTKANPQGGLNVPIYAKSSEFSLAPEGRLSALVVDAIDLGMEESYGSEKHMARIIWQLSITREDGKRHLISRKYNLSTHKDSSLRADVEGMLGRRLTKDEVQQFDIEQLIGINCALTIEHSQTNGRLYANVMEAAPPIAGAPRLEPYGYIRARDRRDGVRSAPRGSLGYRGSSGTRPDGAPPVPSEASDDEKAPF